ncbi:glycerol-3-phosphate dehydrogenase [Cereibacter sphaeroides]|nr:glycerol-3-phosphate dehydrogenase [Cereibacter sphaeroides]
MTDIPTSDLYDLVIIGGGINGCGIARDAAGRGLKVLVAEKGDLAGATSSASTKLFHGGLRYLEYFEFRLVREALIERETLLRAMPHISWPMRFVLPYHAGMRFDGETPTSKLLSFFMPWLKGRRPAWLIRLGLFLYDNLGGRKILPGTTKLDLTQAPEGAPLQDQFRMAYEYSDCWVQDSRLVALNARDAQARGAEILTRTKVTEAKVEDGIWTVTLGDRQVRAKGLVNAAGPWAGEVIKDVLHSGSKEHVRLVRGSHIVTPKLYDHDKAYFFQGRDGRIIFAIPYEQDFTLIGTTDAEHSDPDTPPRCTESERDYLCAFASGYFNRAITPSDVVWTYSGVRPLYDDGARSATAATRDYVLTLDNGAGAPVLNVFGGKITTYRRLAESALEKLGAHLPMADKWTAGVALPGGDFPVDGVAALIAELRARHLFLTEAWATRLIRAYGTEAAAILSGATSSADLGEDFGASLTAREVDWLMDREFAKGAEDVLWRRSKLGLHMTAEQIDRVGAYMTERTRAEA